VVTYHPDGGLAERLASIRSQVARIILVDNSTVELARRRVEEYAAAVPAELVASGANEGVAVALNRGVRLARERGFHWVLCLDQDTIAFTTMVSTLIDAYRSCPQRERVAIVGSRWVGDRSYVDPCDGEQWAERSSVITSGSLLPVVALEAIGPFREDFFIDFVDIEWCLRLRRKGYQAIVACRPAMFHWVGAPMSFRRGGLTFTTSNHSALRRYYITRNRLIVWRTYLGGESRFVVGDIRNALKDTVRIVFLERDRGRKLLALLRGLRDGILTRTGPFPAGPR
jgi:rhamnosyltransferase